MLINTFHVAHQKSGKKKSTALTQAKKIFCIALGWAMEMHTIWLSNNFPNQYDSLIFIVKAQPFWARSNSCICTVWGWLNKFDIDNPKCESHPWNWNITSFENFHVGVFLHNTPKTTCKVFLLWDQFCEAYKSPLANHWLIPLNAYSSI